MSGDVQTQRGTSRLETSASKGYNTVILSSAEVLTDVDDPLCLVLLYLTRILLLLVTTD